MQAKDSNEENQSEEIVDTENVDTENIVETTKPKKQISNFDETFFKNLDLKSLDEK